MKVKVYSGPNCPWCIKVKEFLKENNIGFEEVDVSRDQKAGMELMVRTGQMGIPVIAVDCQFVIGFDQEKLKKLLNL